MKNRLIGLILVLFMTGCTANTKVSSTLTPSNNETTNDMKVYDLDSLKSFVEHGTGVVLLEGTDKNSLSAEEMIKKTGEENGITPSFYKVDDETDTDLIYLINSHNINRVKMLGDNIETPLLLFVEEGMIHSYFVADDFESEDVSALIEESMSELAAYMKANEKDACDSGCKLG